eukprot:COSAG02_NODE_407_length_22898_cov_135.264047_8_plen_189_part_00
MLTSKLIVTFQLSTPLWIAVSTVSPTSTANSCQSDQFPYVRVGTRATPELSATRQSPWYTTPLHPALSSGNANADPPPSPPPSQLLPKSATVVCCCLAMIHVSVAPPASLTYFSSCGPLTLWIATAGVNSMHAHTRKGSNGSRSTRVARNQIISTLCRRRCIDWDAHPHPCHGARNGATTKWIHFCGG